MKIHILLIAAGLIAVTACKQKPATDTAAKTDSIVAEQVPNTLSDKEIADKVQLMFDGTTTTGWRGYNLKAFPEKGWEVVDGTIHCVSSAKGEAGGGGDILFDKKFSNFELTLDWKIAPGGNSGIFYLAQEVPNEPVWKSAPEMQILDDSLHPDAKLGVNGNRKAGALYDLIPCSVNATKPAGEWNSVKVMVYKGTVVHWVNGQQVLEYHLWTDEWKKMVLASKFKDYKWFLDTATEGYIVLQDHGDDVWFRNIKIKEL